MTETEWQPAGTLPPYRGWYTASIKPMRSPNIRRYWDGKRWSAPVRDVDLALPGAAECARLTCDTCAALDYVGRVEWCFGDDPEPRAAAAPSPLSA